MPVALRLLLLRLLSSPVTRQILAVLLIACTIGIDASPVYGAGAPVSMELAGHNPWAILTLLFFGLLLLAFARHCRRLGWKFLGGWARVLLPLLVIIAVTSPRSGIHLWAFFALLGLGVPWMMAYAEKDCQRPVAVLALLLVLAGLTLLFILAICSVVTNVRELSPLGYFQRGFLLLFGVLGLPRRAIRIVGEDENGNSLLPATIRIDREGDAG